LERSTKAFIPSASNAFCVALVSYNILSVVLAALRSVHGIEKIQQNVSSYYLADEIRGTYRGMMIAIFGYNLVTDIKKNYFKLKP
jgi:hypothetical protein